jgi:hypothetical protein
MNVKTASTFALLLGLASAAPAFYQGKVFDWQPVNDEAVRMDPLRSRPRMGRNRWWLDRNQAEALLPIRKLKSKCWRRRVLRIARRPGTSSKIGARAVSIQGLSNGTPSARFRRF